MGEALNSLHLQELLQWLNEVVTKFGLRLLTALVILLVAKFVIKYIRKLVDKVMTNRNVDTAVATFTGSLLNGALWVFTIIIALSQIGIQTTSFIAVIGAAGLAIGLALQGSLSNFAAGFLIIILRPFRVGDIIDAGGISGVVKAISMFTTDIMTFDNRKIIVPNSQIINNVITVITAEPTRRVDFVFSVGFTNDVQKVKDIIKSVLEKHPLILKESPQFIRMAAINKDTMDFNVRVWCNTPDYWTIFYDINEQVKMEFDKNDVVKPFAHFVVHNS